MKNKHRKTCYVSNLSNFLSAPDKNGCVRWLGKTKPNKDGYYSVWDPDLQKLQGLHRIILSRKLNRKIRKNFCACHSCDNSWCLAEDHIWEGSHKDNMNDRDQKNRVKYNRGSKHHQSKLTENKVLKIINWEGTQQAIADKLGIAQVTVSDIKRGRSWSHITGIQR